MRKFLSFIILLLCCALLCSCELDISSQLNAWSSQIYDIASNAGGAYLKETTSAEPPSSTVPVESESSNPDDTTEPSEPEDSSSSEEPEPEVPVDPTPVRPVPTVEQIMSVTLNFDLEKHNAGALAVHNPFANMVISAPYESISSATLGARFKVAREYYGVNPSLHIDISLDGVTEDDSGEMSYAELTQIVQGIQDELGSEDYTLDIAPGTHPDSVLATGDYANLISVMYDGNRGIVPDVGISTSAFAGTTRLTSANLSKPDLMYMFYMLTDLESARGGLEKEYIVNAINVDAFIPSSVTPEEFYGNPQNELSKMVNFRNNPDNNYLELRISNFGYNTVDTTSEYYATEEQQANLLVRSYLLFAELGIDRASICQYKDGDGGKYDGFGTLNADGTPKLAQYYLATMSKVLDGFTFVDKSVTDMGAFIYVFENEAGDIVYAVWSPSNDGSVIENTQLWSYEKHATLTTLTGSYKLENTVLTPNSSGFVSVDALETPSFITIRADESADIEPFVPSREIMTINAIMGAYVNFDLEKSDTNDLSKYNPFGAMRIGNHISAISTSVEGNNIMIAKGFYGMDPTLHLDVDLSKTGVEDDSSVEGFLTYEEIAKKVRSHQSSFGTGMIGAYRIELGSAPDTKMSAGDYALLLSYCYDGNRGEVDKAGIMNSSASAAKKSQLFAGSLSTPNSAYMNGVLEALKTIRGHQNVVAISGFYTDCFIPSSITPESYYLNSESELVKMLELRNTSYSHLEICVSAFGYNTLDSESDYYVTEQKQADYLVRSYLLLAGLGVDHAYLCQYMDKADSEYNGFGTLNADGTAKLAQYYISAMNSTLDGFKFVESVENDQGALIYKFQNNDGNIVYAVWNGTGDGSTISDVKITVDRGTPSVLTLNNTYTPDTSSLSVDADDSTVSVDAGETPVFVIIK